MSGIAEALPSWRDTPTRQSIVDFVAAVTDAQSGEFVPEADRIAVFDNDGTLWAESPMYAQLAFAMDRAAELGQPTTLEELKAGGVGALLDLVKLTHGNITTDEFDQACRKWMTASRHPRFGVPYLSTVYQPMLELLALLDDRGFSCWIFSEAVGPTSCGCGQPSCTACRPTGSSAVSERPSSASATTARSW